MADLAALAGRLAAMGHRKRLLIVELLSRQPRGLVAGDIREAVNLSGPALSHHLHRLHAEGLVDVRRDGTFLWYTLNRQAMSELEDQLSTVLSGDQVEIEAETPSREDLDGLFQIESD